MNKKLLVAVAGVAIVVVGGIAVAATRGSNAKPGAYRSTPQPSSAEMSRA